MTRFFLKTQAESGPSRQMAKAAMCLLAESVRDKEILERLDLTITEAFANVVRHAYKEDEPGVIEVVLSLCPPTHVEVEVNDWGCGFRTWPVDVCNAPPEREGGRGLYIMSELTDDLEIRRNEGKNTVYFKVIVRETQWKQ